MADTTRRKLLSFSALAPIVGIAGVALVDTDPRHSRSAAQGLGEPKAPVSGREKIRRRYLPDLPLLTHEGNSVSFYDDLVKGKVVTINFFYSRCDEICPLVISNLVQVQKLLGRRVGRDIFMYSITLKPEEDTVKVINEFRQMHGIGPGWTFLTGKSETVEMLRRKLGFTYPDPVIDKDKSQHIGNVRYGNEPLGLWAACPGQANPAWIVESISWVERSNVRNKV